MLLETEKTLCVLQLCDLSCTLPFPFLFPHRDILCKKKKKDLSNASDILFLSDRKSGNNHLFRHVKRYTHQDIQRVEEHSEADLELKATAFTHKINTFTQITTVNEISYKSNIKMPK